MDIVDKKILDACINAGDKTAFHQLYTSCYHYMMSIVLRYSKGNQEAKWLLNQCFAKVALNLEKYDRTQSFKSWMSRVTINEILDQMRKDRRRKAVESSYNGIRAHSIGFNGGEEHLAFGDLLNMLDVLPQQTKTVFNLYAIDGFKHREIAEKLQISVGTSKWHLAQARNQLQKMVRAARTLPGELKKRI